MTDHGLYAAEGVAFTIVVGAIAVWLVAAAVGRRRRDLDLRRPMLTAFIIRIVAAATLGLTSFGASIRGGDEPGFVAEAHQIANSPFPSRLWLHALDGHLHITVNGILVVETGSLHTFLLAAQIRLFDASVFAGRVTMATISVIGLLLIAAAVYELAGAKAARITAWILAVEPANIFFSTAIHKEPPLFLAEGMVAFGGALLWRKARFGPIVLMVFGCLIATASRPYIGYFLGAGSTLLLLHVALRSASTRTGFAVAAGVVVLGIGILSTPAIVNATSKQELQGLQNSQNANTSDNSNLKLEPVNFSTRTAIVTNLPQRMFDLMFRPFPWQLGSASQQLGVIETLFVFAALFFFVRAVARRTRPPLLTAAPLLYPAFMLLIAYSIAVGNAGTGFRYRTHIIILLIGIVVVMRARGMVPFRRPAFPERERLAPAGAQT